MDLCDQCGNKSLMPEHYSDVCLCKKCSMKLLSSTWKNKEYIMAQLSRQKFDVFIMN